MADALRLGPLCSSPQSLRSEIIKLISRSLSKDSAEWKFVCPNQTARGVLTRNVYQRILESTPDANPSSFILFDPEKYGTISSIFGFIKIIPPNKPFQVTQYLTLCISNLILAPLHYDDGIQFIWRCIKLLSVQSYILHDVIGKHIGSYWYWDHLCIVHDHKGNGYRTKLVHLAQQKCAMDLEYSKEPIFVMTYCPEMVSFYAKNGFKVVVDMEMGLPHCYGMLYHFDERILKQWTDLLAENICYEQYFDIWTHVLPRTLISWVMFTNLIMILIPFLVFYFPAIWLTRYISPESTWDRV